MLCLSITTALVCCCNNPLLSPYHRWGAAADDWRGHSPTACGASAGGEKGRGTEEERAPRGSPLHAGPGREAGRLVNVSHMGKYHRKVKLSCCCVLVLYQKRSWVAVFERPSRLSRGWLYAVLDEVVLKPWNSARCRMQDWFFWTSMRLNILGVDLVTTRMPLTVDGRWRCAAYVTCLLMWCGGWQFNWTTNYKIKSCKPGTVWPSAEINSK